MAQCKESACQCRRCRSGRSPGEGNGNAFQYSCLGNPTDRQRGLAGYNPWGCKRVVHNLVAKQQQQAVFFIVFYCF